MLYLHTSEDVACYCVSFVKEAFILNGDTDISIEIITKNSKLDDAFRFLRISGKTCSTEIAVSKKEWNRVKKCLMNSRWQITNTQT